MKTCPQCGFHHTDLDERCIRCNAYLDPLGAARRGKPDKGEGAKREQFKFSGAEVPRWRPRLPGLLGAWARRRFYFLGRALTSDLPRDVHHRNVWTAAFLSIVPGAGQLYNHQPKKALLILLFVAGCLGLAVATLRQPWSNWILLGCLGAMVYSFHDALVTAKRINRDYFIWQHGVAYYCAWFFYIFVFCLTFQYAAAHFLVQFRHIGHNVLAPYLCRGDRVVVWMPGRPRVGDVVMYTPHRLHMEIPGDIFNMPPTFKPHNMIERVVAGPGQTFERREGVFYRDGQPVALREEPLLTEFIPWNFSLKAPEDGYIIILSDTFGRSWLTGQSAPKLNAGGVIVKNWPEACVVRRDQIKGRVWFIYNPPESRRILR